MSVHVEAPPGKNKTQKTPKHNKEKNPKLSKNLLGFSQVIYF